MAPPGLHGFSETLTTLNVATGFLSLSLSSTMSLVAPLASSLKTDHDYIFKYKVEPKLGLQPSEDMWSGDAMLSSSALDLDIMMTDTDFLDDLGDMTFNINDLEPNDDFPMEESFQDFIDSALDKSFSSQYEWEAEEIKETEGAFKKDVMRSLGLQPVHNHNEQTVSSCKNSNSERKTSHPAFRDSSSSLFDSALLSPASYLGTTPSSGIPTKQCTYSQQGSTSPAIYTTAGQTSPHILSSASTHIPFLSHPSSSPTHTHHHHHNGNISHTRLNCIQNRDVLAEFYKPLTIDVSSGLLPLTSQHRSQPNPPLTSATTKPERYTEELLIWLSEQQTTNLNNDNISLTEKMHAKKQADFDNSKLNIVNSYMDLEDFLNDKEQTADPRSQSQLEPLIQHDHTYQKFADENESEHPSHLRLSFLEDVKGNPSPKDNYLNDELKEHLKRVPSIFEYESTKYSNDSISMPSPVSSLSSSSSYLSPGLSDTETEKEHLDILNLFSDEVSSSMLHGDSPVPHFRFM